ncbi:unnamed protein product, partial [Allacma fusca]
EEELRSGLFYCACNAFLMGILFKPQANKFSSFNKTFKIRFQSIKFRFICA